LHKNDCRKRKLSKPNILITGGAGYIGSITANILKNQGYNLVILDNLVHGHKYIVRNVLNLPLIEGDVGDKELLRHIFKDYDIDAIMHFSAYAYVGESVENPLQYYENNVVHTLNLLNEMVANKVRFFVFSSTCATYGIPSIVPIPEDHAQNPINPYGNTKLVIEKALQDYHNAYDLRFVIFRYFNAAGADPLTKIGENHAPETHLIPLLLDAAIGRRPNIKVFGTDYDTPDGTCIRDYIHVNDLARAHILGLKHLMAGKTSDIFNLSNGHGYSVRKVIDIAKKVTGKDFSVLEVKRRVGDPSVLVGDAQKAKKELGWHEEFSDLSIIVKHAWKWHQKLVNIT
jgi:UDP-glucose 4-epimerase